MSRDELSKRQANAAIALLRMKQPAQVWPLLKHDPDPRLRSYLIDRIHPMGADAAAIFKHLNEDSDMSVRRALILSLGPFGENDLAPEDRQAVLTRMQAIYQNEPIRGCMPRRNGCCGNGSRRPG